MVHAHVTELSLAEFEPQIAQDIRDNLYSS